MDASPALRDFRGGRLEHVVLARLGRSLAASLFALVALAGVLVCARRATGALGQPLSPAVLGGLGVLLVVAALVFRRAWADPWASRGIRYAVWSAPSVVLLCWLLGVTLEGTDAFGAMLFVGLLVAEEGWSWGRLGTASEHPRRPEPIERPVADRQVAAPSPLERFAGEAAAIAADEPDESVSQHVVRRREDDGEVIEGWTRIELAATERHATAHVAICPPLSRVPQCYAEQMDGPPARLKVAQVLAYGVRFEIKLEEPAEEPTSVVIEFSIHEQPADDAAE